MSVVIKGFVSNSAAKNNLLGRTAIFGELSQNARTFSKEILEYANIAHPGIELNLFHATNGGAKFSPESAYTSLLLEIGAWVYERGILLNGSSSSQLQDFIAAFENSFNGRVAGITAGPLRSDGTYKLPEVLRFSMMPNGGIQSEVNLWFGIEDFETNYDQYEIVVIPPVEDLAVFFQTQALVKTATEARPVDVMTNLVDTAKGKKPPTHVFAQTVMWYNASQPTQTLPTSWFVLIYGPKGNNSEAIAQALRTYALANSLQSSENWKIVMPDLFRATQFTVLPRWDKYAITPTSVAGIYAPYGNVTEMLQFAKNKLPSIATTYISDRLEAMHHPYRSIMLLVVPGSDNRVGAQSMQDLIPTYIGQEGLGEDFSRQSEYTKQWVTQMGNLLRVAELYGAGGTTVSLATGMRLVTHLGLECVAMKIKDVEFLVALKRNYAPV